VHSATPLQDLCVELHTHTRYKTWQTTQLHTHSSLQHIAETSLTIKYILDKKELLMTLTLYLTNTFGLGYISFHSSSHRVTQSLSWKMTIQGLLTVVSIRASLRGKP
jgi:hypothetical protein